MEKKQRENLPKGSKGFQITNGLILFGFLMIWVVILTIIRAVEIKLGFIPQAIITFLIFWSLQVIIKKRREKLKVKQNERKN
ncbi:MAG: hypothetical protein HQ538_05080 [Parcubacteria group bacterium]|nr:hypothetical protein [Parcubacteria group bacterium]